MEEPMIRRLAIQFDRNNATFIPGELVSGKILAEFTQPKQITGLRVVVSGDSAVRWFSKKYEPDPDREYQPTDTSSIKMMTGKEEYFSLKFHLLGSDSGSPFALPAGSMAQPFEFQLPNKLPCSFEHENAYVRYTIRANLNCLWERDHEAKATFTVISTYDLNKKAEASVAIREDIIKNFFCSCICPTGKIYARFYVPSVGFVPGQVIPVTVHCENESTVDVSKLKVSLRKKLKFYAKSPEWKTKLEETIVAETKRVSPFTNNSEERITIQLKVPPLPPTGLEHCGLIDVDYVLRVVMCFTGMHFSVKRCFPILIGTVPLHNSINTNKPNTGSRVIPHSSHWDPKNLPPPSYDTTLYAGFRSIGDENESTRVYVASNPFVPRYPVYNESVLTVQFPIIP